MSAPPDSLDIFAAAALQGMLSNPKIMDKYIEKYHRDVHDMGAKEARRCYHASLAMEAMGIAHALVAQSDLVTRWPE